MRAQLPRSTGRQGMAAPPQGMEALPAAAPRFQQAPNPSASFTRGELEIN